MDSGILIVLAIIAFFAITVLSAAIKIVQEYERGVVFRLGRYVGTRGPGLVFLIPFVERMVRVDLRTITLDIPSQEVITRDNVTVKVNAVCYFRALDPERAVIEINDFVRATSQIAQTTLRAILGQADLDTLLAEREQINMRLQEIIDEQTEPWGVKVSIVEVKDVELPQSMQRAMARQAEAERDKRARIISAEGEFLAAERLSQAAAVIGREPTGLQLRYLQTLGDIAVEQNSTILFPIPIEMLRALEGIGNLADALVPQPDAPETNTESQTPEPDRPERPTFDDVVDDPDDPTPGSPPA